MPEMTPAHDQTETKHYVVHYPDHFPRTDDPHYKDFNAFHRKWSPTARCAFALHFEQGLSSPQAPVRQMGHPGRLIGFGESVGGCDTTSPMELHHSHIEFALANQVDLATLEHDYPGVSDPDTVGAWVESGANFTWLCVFHHRGHGGAHTASASDYEAERYVRGLIT